MTDAAYWSLTLAAMITFVVVFACVVSALSLRGGRR